MRRNLIQWLQFYDVTKFENVFILFFVQKGLLWINLPYVPQICVPVIFTEKPCLSSGVSMCRYVGNDKHFQ